MEKRDSNMIHSFHAPEFVVLQWNLALAAASAVVMVRRDVRKSGRWAVAMANVMMLDDRCEAPINRLRRMVNAIHMHVGGWQQAQDAHN